MERGLESTARFGFNDRIIELQRLHDSASTTARFYGIVCLIFSHRLVCCRAKKEKPECIPDLRNRGVKAGCDELVKVWA